ncbi:MAG: helix-turn-helix transcriptional regulator [Gemmatimonadales bacterium]|jgi:transcriptional regulator with XRE-family HTH domain|nr:helix-turn-helix transcriptional regulator [Gemmatimonadales bacterium]
MRISLGSALRALRESRSVSLRKMESLGGPSRESTRLYEAGTTIPTVEALNRLLNALNEPLDSEVAADLLQRVRAARGETVGGLHPDQQKQLVETVVRLILARDPRRMAPAIQLDARLEVERELVRLGVVQRRCL